MLKVWVVVIKRLKLKIEVKIDKATYIEILKTNKNNNYYFI